ncbi:UDP-N-acetylglucosamine transferase subunit ALG14 homolog [Cotesia glomerata]|uniref:UDP-N-acetylglucosamine transferase subunit ALG14 homolog n=1 Tax=Cotesia glomerata TaxID=32391 RepID=UPI001D01EB32|nr:UDP-N-acetylglucosamine transferase subunit ALG14 homolog [Cotesia glomerata]
MISSHTYTVDNGLGYHYLFLIPLLIFLTARFIYLIFNRGKLKNNLSSVKTMIILGSGGHTTEMFKVLNFLDLDKYSPRVYVHGHSDLMSELKLKSFEVDNDCKVIKIFRSREVGQSYYTSVITTLIAFINAGVIMFREKPDLILANGPGTCVPLCLVAFIFQLFFFNDTTVIFIESFCRVKTLSLTGKILYFFADHIILQWPYICREKYNVHVIK